MIRTPPVTRPPGLVLWLALLGAALLAGCNPQGGAAAGPPGGAGGPPPAMPVTVVQVQAQKVPLAIETVGTLEGVREVEVRARVAGTLQRQLYREGEPVRAGAVLFRIDRAPFEIAADAARAALAQAESRAEQARRENARSATLIAERAISQREADDARSAQQTAEAQLLAARAQLRDAQLSVGYSEVTAPISGVAQRAQRSEGALLSPAADGALLTTIVQTDPIRVRFALTEAELAQLRRGSGRQVRLQLPDGKFSAEAGRLDFAGSVVDPRLGTVQMRAELPNPRGEWLPGQFVRAQLVTGEQEAFLVPQAAVMSGDQGRFVWVVGADGKAAPKPVVAGAWLGTDWVIRSGLANGDRVITSNLIKLRPGVPVAPAAPGAGGPPGSGAPPAASAPADAGKPGAASAPASGAAKPAN
jgi:membrane fusion protein (multidrug efflux system)